MPRVAGALQRDARPGRTGALAFARPPRDMVPLARRAPGRHLRGPMTRLFPTAAPLLSLVLACAHVPPPEGSGPHAPAIRPLDARLSGFAYPHPVKLHTVVDQQQELQLAYMDVHPSVPNGQTVLLLHGKNFSGAYWARTIESLQAAGYRVVVPDQIGFGKSSKPAHFQYTFHALAAHTLSLLDALDVERVSVVGHSMGGMLGTRLTLLAPEQVRRLALVNPIGLEDWQRHVPYRPVQAQYESELKSTPDSIRDYMREAYFAGTWKPAYEPLVEILGGWALGPDRERIAWTAALTSDMVFTQPVVHDLDQLHVPTLLIIGQRDRTAIGRAWAPDEVKDHLGDYVTLGRRAATSIPGARLVELEGVGHMPQVEAFDAYAAALLGFLGGD